MILRHYLKSFGVKDSFFSKSAKDNKYYSVLDFKNDSLGFKSQSLLGKINVGNDFLRLKEVFPKDKKIEFKWIKINPSFYGYNFSFPGDDFEEANLSYKKACVEIDILFNKTNNNLLDIYDLDDYKKILKKFNFTLYSSTEYRFAGLADGMNEAYFHHKYKKHSMYGDYSELKTNYFCMKENKKFSPNNKSRIFFIDIDQLSNVDDIEIRI